eukprot:scaffold145239_cov45-Attheya_sp.AAC.1
MQAHDADSEPELSDESVSSPTVAVIGCGPGGMSFLHAIATKRKQFEEAGDLKGLLSLPKVTVFEKAAAPGGVWRSNRNLDGEDMSNGATNMYEGLWINDHKYNMEYFDYTFDEHFKTPQPLFLPRQHVLEYIIARVTQHEDIFENVNFNTEVKSVTYDDQMGQFIIRSSDESDIETVQYFDKCIWAAGCNGKPKMIPEVLNKLSNFKGKIVHASEMDKLGSGDQNAVKGKNILMIGDSYSAEDLTLQCIKLGANEINIMSRNCDGTTNNTGSWPEDKVDIHEYAEVAGVKDDGTGTTILLTSLEPEEYPAAPEVEDISIIIFCTGYHPANDFLADNLNPFKYEKVWKLQDVGLDPDTWRMTENPMTEVLGHVVPSEELHMSSELVEELFHRRMLIDNPNMMVLIEQTDLPLLDIDAGAWLILAYVTGEKDIPTKEEMLKGHMQDLLLTLNSYDGRCMIDENYIEANKSVPESHWSDNYENEEYNKYYSELSSLPFQFLARDMKDGNYPFQIGDINGLNKTGLTMIHYELLSLRSHSALEFEDEETQRWKTFRDVDPSNFTSYFTGTGSIPLKGKWLELDDEGNLPSSNDN